MSDRLDPRLRDALVGVSPTHNPGPEREKELAMMIDKQVAALARERRVMQPMFIYLTLFCTALLLVAGYSEDMGKRLWFGILACFWFLFGTMFLLRYHVNRVRVEMMVELKNIQIQLERLKAGGSGSDNSN